MHFSHVYTFIFLTFINIPSVITSDVDDILFGFSSRDFIDRLPRWNEFSLSKRDVCTDAIPGTITETCTPGVTLCCVPSSNTGASNTFPQCQDISSKGYCCISNTSCYIDTTSNCAATGAVKCSKCQNLHFKWET